MNTRRRMLGGLIATAYRPEVPPVDIEPIYLHVFALRVTEGPMGFTDTTVHISDGPYELAAARAKLTEIGSVGLLIGSEFFPAHRILLVQMRPN